MNVRQARSDWAPDPHNPFPTFDPPRRVPHGVTLLGQLFDEGTVAQAGIALERARVQGSSGTADTLGAAHRGALR